VSSNHYRKILISSHSNFAHHKLRRAAFRTVLFSGTTGAFSSLSLI